MMPVRDVVIFPHMMTPFVVGRESSVRALEEALAGDKKIFLATQHDASVDEPRPDEIYSVGTIVNIVQSLKQPDGNIKVLVEGVERARVVSVTDDEGFFRGVVRTVHYRVEPGPQLEALVSRVSALFEQYIKLSQNLNYETMIAAIRVDDAGKLADTVGANLQLTIEEKQELLEIFDPIDRLTRVAEMLDIEIEKLNMDRTIQGRVKRQMEKAQKEYYLNEKIKAIQKELGRGEKSEIDELKKKIESAGMTKDAHEKAMAELKRLENMPPMSAESTVSRNYLDWLLAVPWKQKSKEIRDLKYAETVLEADHYGLAKVKERIVEFLAVRRLVKNPKGSILCFVGAPGVGKTSLGMSIARATGRKFIRLSLGGVRDEAEVRGHRRTYIGALPGQIHPDDEESRDTQSGLHAGRSGQDVDGLPGRSLGGAAGSAGSGTEFHVHGSLPGRGVRSQPSVLHLHGQRPAHRPAGAPGPHGSHPAFRLHRAGEARDRETVPGEEADEADRPEREAAPVYRPGDHEPDPVLHPGSRRAEPGAGDWQHLPQGGPRGGQRAKRQGENGVALRGNPSGERFGVSGAGEVSGPGGRQEERGGRRGRAGVDGSGRADPGHRSHHHGGKGKLFTTGKLGDVMQESAQAAMSYIRSRAHLLGLPRDFYRNLDIHVHVPEGAIPKDGPSAGITIATAIASALTRIPVRCNVAMTGEITLRGKVLPIGGLKEKLLAAHRHGMQEAILPKDNEKDLPEIPENDPQGDEASFRGIDGRSAEDSPGERSDGAAAGSAGGDCHPTQRRKADALGAVSNQPSAQHPSPQAACGADG